MFIEVNNARLIRVKDIVAVGFYDFPNNFVIYTTHGRHPVYPRLEPIASQTELLEQYIAEQKAITEELERCHGRFIRANRCLLNKDMISAVVFSDDTITFTMEDGQEFPIVYESKFIAQKAYETFRTML